MTLHFAYGSNMSRALMGARCPGAMALGVATLAGWRFVINPDGVGSIAPHPGALLRGVLWRRLGTGRARPGYISLVVNAAREWSLPQAYVDTLRRWSPSGWRGARAKDTGEVG
jgi:hypothetical protein